MDDIDGAQLQEILQFIDSLGMSADWDLLQTTPPDLTLSDRQIGASASYNVTSQPDDERPSPESSEGLELAPFGLSLPSAPRDNSDELQTITNTARPQQASSALPADPQLYTGTRLVLEEALNEYRHLITDFTLPSEHSLLRYLTSYFEGFHPHLPFVHLPSASPRDFTPDVLLALATIGAQYSFEHRAATALHKASRAILEERLRWSRGARSRLRQNVVQPSSQGSLPTRISTPRSMQITPESRDQYEVLRYSYLQSLRASTLLIGYGSWDSLEMLEESFNLSSVVMECMRFLGAEEGSREYRNSMQPPIDQWASWARHESDRRVQLMAFTWLDVLALAYDRPIMVRSREVCLDLPCSTREWFSKTEAEWFEAREQTKQQRHCFRDTLSWLCGETASLEISGAPADATSLGNYVLLHGLLQKIFIARELSDPLTKHTILPDEQVEKLLSHLRAWTSMWQQTPESSLDPRNKDGPIPFTSAALLSLAYVRLCLDIGPHRHLATRDHLEIATGLQNCPPLQRNAALVPALIYAVNALSIPVRLGIQRVARSQAFLWSVRHGLASLECAVLVFKWLAEMRDFENEHSGRWTRMEQRLLEWVRKVVQEAVASTDELSLDETDQFGNPMREPFTLGIQVLRIWAFILNSNVQWSFLNLIGLALAEYADRMESQADTFRLD